MSQGAPLELKVEYRRLNGFFADYARHIAGGQIFIASPSALPVGTPLRFRLLVPGINAENEVRLDGAVDWVRSPADVVDKPGVQPGMGVRFIFRDEAERQRFQAQAERLLSGSLGERLARSLLAEGRRQQGSAA